MRLLIKALRRLHIKSLWRLLGLVATHPLFVWPTYSATKRCMEFANQHYPGEHHTDGPANAFRHALWNWLIASFCNDWSKNPNTSVHWAKAITDWHEEAFYSNAFPMQMDYHNNAVGRNLFLEKQLELHDSVKEILTLSKNAVKISSDTDLSQIKNQLVYISDEY